MYSANISSFQDVFSITIFIFQDVFQTRSQNVFNMPPPRRMLSGYVPLKNGTRDFQNSPPFERSMHVFMWQSLEISIVFSILSLKQIF